MRAIDADALKKDLTRFYNNEVTAKQLIDEQPTIEPRKKGKWKQVHVGGFTPGGNSLSVCSECGWEFGTHRIYPDYNFCPNCGADMREDAEEAKKCDTCKHEKERWFSRCADCSDYELWEGKEE